MIGLEWLEELISYALASTYLEKERPVSLLIIADSESGKTEILNKYIGLENVIYITSFTRIGILNEYGRELERGIKRSIIIPDMIQVLDSLSPSIRSTVIAFILGIVEEGLVDIQTAKISIKPEKPIRANIIGALPRYCIEDERRLRRWAGIGFASRVLPISYDYSAETEAKILNYIIYRGYKREELPLYYDKLTELVAKGENHEIEIEPDKAIVLLALSRELAQTIRDKLNIEGKEEGGKSWVAKVRGFRMQRQLQTLAMARALLNDRDKVTDEDIKRITELAHWINLSFNYV